jgi:peptide/nickel transport system substrate-binding protein
LKRSSRMIFLGVGLAAVALVAVACGSSSSGPPAINVSGAIPASINNYNPTPTGTKVSGGTVYWAQAPSGAPNYIFPMTSAAVCGTNNVEYLSAMLYRPLYWYGNNNSPTIDYNYSIGQPPVWSDNDQTVSVTLNNWKWSNGEQVTSRDVEFWVNLYKSDPAANYCAYVPPAANGEKFFPDNVISMSTPSPSTIVFHLSQSYNPTWFLYNELSQITPLPLAWDRTSLSQPAPTSDNGHLPDSTTAGALAVYKFLNAQSMSTGTWASSPIWSVVDGPFKLTAFTATGEVDMVANPDYSGSPKPTISKFVELPFTDNDAQLTALKTSGPSGVTIGYLPPEDSTQQSSLEGEGYSMASAYTFSFNYYVLNLHNPTLGPVFSQLYFRQAFQHLQDQDGWIAAYLNGWAVPTSGPVPLVPPNSFSSAMAKTNVYAFSVSTASKLLSSNGWKVNPGGVTTCVKPGTATGDCGAGVASGTKLEFNLDYESGVPSVASEMQSLQANASQVGIKLDLTTHNFNTVVAAAATCTPSQSTCKWTAENWGGGWVYAPDFYPSGESLFQPGAAANFSNYSDPKATSLILATTTASAADSQSALDAYQDYIIQDLPVVFGPTQLGNPIPGGPSVISKKLGGVTPNAFSYITPETYYFTS